MPPIRTSEIIGVMITLLLLPVVFIVVGIGLLWLLVIIPILFVLAVLLLKVQIWVARKRFDDHTIEGHSVVIEEHVIERDDETNHTA